MNIECPKCTYFNEVDGDDLNDHSCESEDFECKNCEHEFKIGWYATVELR